MSDFQDNDPSKKCKEPSKFRQNPIVILVVGMAGSGKTTLMHRINLHMVAQNLRAYYINLDPAVKNVPYQTNIDIRDTVNYKEVMQQYGLGPNGAILTSLNLFATRFHQVIEILENRAESLDYIFVDTPGQIEAFTWSAGGQIIHDLLASAFPTIIMYITDTPRCKSPTTFMSNMLYACSVLYKSRLPMLLTFNKTDIESCEFAMQWMTDFEAYQDAVDSDSDTVEGYIGSLNRSLSLSLDEFYGVIEKVGVSAITGEGIEDVFISVAKAAKSYHDTYLPDLAHRQKEQAKIEASRQKKHLDALTRDLKDSKGDQLVVDANKLSLEEDNT
jgi:GTPase SAR1 family protein